MERLTAQKVKVLVCDLLVSQHEAELPEICPKCSRPIVETGICEERMVRQTLSMPFDSADKDPFASALRGPAQEQLGSFAIGYSCRLCEATLVKGNRSEAQASAIEVIESLRTLLWPNGNADTEWDSETIDNVASILHESGYGIK